MTVTINGTTGIAGVDGSAATPAAQGADTNTGIFYGTDIVGISTGGTERVRVDASGNVGIGTSSPQGKFDVTGTGDTVALVTTNTSGNPRFGMLVNGVVYNWIQANRSDLSMQFATGNTERMRIDSSGNLLVGTTVPASAGHTLYPEGVYRTARTGTSSQQHIVFRNGNGDVGAISTSAGTTTYATSSDYRLKENIQPMQNALAVVQQLNPVTYTWKADGSDGQGFIAHELQAVVPDCVTGEKDDVDEDGNPIYQGIDTSFLVATLCKAIQELNEKVEAQAAEIAALKGV